MEYITVTAKTLDDAITDALVELGVTSDKLEYEVVEKGSAGFLGIGIKQAVIKARRKEEPVEKEDLESLSGVEKEENSGLNKKGKGKERKKEKKYEKKVEKKSESKEEIKKEAEETAPGVDEDSEKLENGEKQGKIGDNRDTALPPVEEKTIESCKKFIEDVLNAMGMKDVLVTAKVDEDGALSINLEGANMGILIGKRGQTLDALQYLANRVANKMQDGYVRVKLDTEDYRRRRKQTLENLAKNIAGKVKRTRKSVFLEPMNPYERRIIHSALQGDPAVTTHSEGEEPYRRVVVTLVRK